MPPLTNPLSPITISALGYHLPARRVTVEELVAAGRTHSDAAKLRTLGYDTVHVADEERVEEMALQAIEDLVRRSGFDLARTSMILYGGGLATSAMIDPGPTFAWSATDNPLPFFKFPGTYVQHALGLPDVPVMGVGQLACNALHGCVRTARALLLAEPALEHVLCVASDRFPPTAGREIVYNLMSDGAAAVVVSRGGERNRILASTQVTRGRYWDGESAHDHLVAAYFPLARQAILAGVAAAGLGVADLDLFVPHNINAKSWDILAGFLGLPRDRVFTDNIARVGHVVAADNVINHLDALAAGRLRPGARVAWFVTGFGAHWSCTILEV